MGLICTRHVHRPKVDIPRIPTHQEKRDGLDPCRSTQTVLLVSPRRNPQQIPMMFCWIGRGVAEEMLEVVPVDGTGLQVVELTRLPNISLTACNQRPHVVGCSSALVVVSISCSTFRSYRHLEESNSVFYKFGLAAPLLLFVSRIVHCRPSMTNSELHTHK